MHEKELRSILGRVGVRAGRTNPRGWMEFSCPLSPWTHANGADGRASAAAKVVEDGPSSFVCKACHHHGRISKLVRMLADLRGDNSIRPLMREADMADSEAQVSSGFPAFDAPRYEDDEPEPLDEGAYADLYDSVHLHDDAMAYLRDRRGVSPDTATKLDLRFDPRQRRILFPVRDRAGKLFGFSGRAIDDSTKLKIRDYFGLPKRHLILGEHAWRDGYPKIIVEGLFAYAHMAELGMEDRADYGALLGSAVTEHKAARLIHADCPVLDLHDNDPGGDIGIFGTINPTSKEREENGMVHYVGSHIPLMIPEWPEGKDDPDQLTREEVDAMLDHTPIYGARFEFDKACERWV